MAASIQALVATYVQAFMAAAVKATLAMYLKAFVAALRLFIFKPLWLRIIKPLWLLIFKPLRLSAYKPHGSIYVYKPLRLPICTSFLQCLKTNCGSYIADIFRQVYSFTFSIVSCACPAWSVIGQQKTSRMNYKCCRSCLKDALATMW